MCSRRITTRTGKQALCLQISVPVDPPILAEIGYEKIHLYYGDGDAILNLDDRMDTPYRLARIFRELSGRISEAEPLVRPPGDSLQRAVFFKEEHP